MTSRGPTTAWPDAGCRSSTGATPFTVWYADAAGELVGVLTHERDADYERGGELLSRRAGLDEALAGPEARR